jgi:hypothetical protein
MQLIFTLFLIFSSLCIAQDERYYRELFTGELFGEFEKEFKPKLVVRTSIMLQDLNRDGIQEGIIVSKRDGQDWIHILRRDGTVLFKAKLPAKAQDSQLYKIKIKALSHMTDVMVLYFYEGAHKTANFLATARLYFITIDDRDLTSMKIAQGPYYFVEKQQTDLEYWNRFFHVNVYDFNGDGHREISVSYNRIQRIFSYHPKYGWRGN